MTAVIDIHAHGYSEGNPGPGGYAAILTGNRIDNLPFEYTASGGALETTNNRMELMAVIKGLESLDHHVDMGHIDHRHSVNVYSDSKHPVDALNHGWVANWRRNGWKKTKKQHVANRDLWERLIELNTGRGIAYIWVKGHADIRAAQAIAKTTTLEFLSQS